MTLHSDHAPATISADPFIVNDSYWYNTWDTYLRVDLYKGIFFFIAIIGGGIFLLAGGILLFWRPWKLNDE